jgi:hypothetical protein
MRYLHGIIFFAFIVCTLFACKHENILNDSFGRGASSSAVIELDAYLDGKEIVATAKLMSHETFKIFLPNGCEPRFSVDGRKDPDKGVDCTQAIVPRNLKFNRAIELRRRPELHGEVTLRLRYYESEDSGTLKEMSVKKIIPY